MGKQDELIGHWLTRTGLSCRPSFSALFRRDPLRIYGKVLRFLKLESSRQQVVNEHFSLLLFSLLHVFFHSVVSTFCFGFLHSNAYF